MQTIKYLVETKLESATDRYSSELQPFFQQAYQVFNLRAFVDPYHVEIHTIVLFQIRG